MTSSGPQRRQQGGRGSDVLRQLLEGQARSDARWEGFAERLEAVAQDAREARDLVNKVAVKIEEQDIVVRFAEHRREVAIQVEAVRTDVAAAVTKVRGDLAELSKRVEILEAERNKVIGVASFFSWLSRVGPWLAAGLLAGLAASGFKIK